MENLKHTNEAWKSSLNPLSKNKEYIIETVSDSKLIARVQSEEVSDEETEANAKLISEAPNLLKALIKIISIADEKVEYKAIEEIIQIAKQNIDKATQ